MADDTASQFDYVIDGVHLTSLGFPPDQIKNVKEFKFFDDDVLIATYPKAGRSDLFSYSF